MEVAMLDEAEYAIAYKLYVEAFGKGKSDMTKEERFAPVVDYYRKITGVEEKESNAIMHHRINLYGEPCTKCGKPLRTPQALFCAACGNKKTTS